MLYIEVDEFMLHDLMRKADRDNFSEEGYEWIINEYYSWGVDEEFDPIAIDSTFTESGISEAFKEYGYLMSESEYYDVDGNFDPILFVSSLAGFTTCHILSNDNIIYEVF